MVSGELSAAMAAGAARRVGLWASIACAAFSIAYILGQLFEWLGMLGSAGGPDSASTPLGITILLTPSLLLGPAFLVMMSALHQTAVADRRIFSQVALAFAIIYATLISMVYFVQLTLVAPRIVAGDAEDIAFLLFVPYRSFLFAVDLLGYSMMSLSTLFGAFALPSCRPGRIARLFMILNGALLPFLAFQMFLPSLIYAAALWAVTLPGAALAVAVVFRRMSPNGQPYSGGMRPDGVDHA